MSGTEDGKRCVTGRENSARSFLEGVVSLAKDPLVALVRSAALEYGVEVWLVGGVLRNLALGVSAAPDYDFVTAGGDLKAFCGSLAASFGGSAFLLDKDTLSYRIAAVFDGRAVTLDLSPVKGDILNDLGQRDFTVNSIAVALSDIFERAAPRVIDPVAGVGDAAKRLLRATSSGVFDDDPLRSLRAVRLSLQYGLGIAPETLSLMKEKSGLLERTSAERKRDELVAVFSSRGTPEALRLMYSTGIIGAVLPEAAGWVSVDGYGLLDHSLKTLESAEDLLDGLAVVFPGYANELGVHFNRKLGAVETKTVFKLAAFLHDFGKPYSMKREEGRLRFIGHDSAGAPLVRQFLLGLRFSRKIANEVAGLVKDHHRVFNLALLREPSRKAKAHFFRAAKGSSGVTLLCLAVADSRATRGGADPELVRLAEDMLGFYYGVYLRKRPGPLLTGGEIMKRFGLSEGPLVGEALREVFEGVERGEVSSKKEAVALIERLLAGRKDR